MMWSVKMQVALKLFGSGTEEGGKRAYLQVSRRPSTDRTWGEPEYLRLSGTDRWKCRCREKRRLCGGGGSLWRAGCCSE